MQASMSWYFNRSDIWSNDRASRRNMDNEESRKKIKMIHMLAKLGATWLPKDLFFGNWRRSSLIAVNETRLYGREVIWIVSKYNAGNSDSIEELIRTPSIRSPIYQHMDRVNKLLKNF